MAKKLSKEEWERRVNEVGAGRYDFVRWAVDGEFGMARKCILVCRVDGFKWPSKVGNLINNNRGCPQCANQRRWTAEERIEQINKLENIEFVCWVDSYKNAHSKAIVRCTIDGFEWRTSVDHLVNTGSGCPECAIQIRWSESERVSQINSIKDIEFVSWSNRYKNAFSKANVRCSKDGFEWSTEVNCLVNMGTGCPRCAKYGYQLDKTGYLYALRSECGRYVKIGISNKPSQRHKQLELATPFKFNLVEQVHGDGVKIAELEKSFHEKHESAGFTGFSGATEWLVFSDELLSELRRLSIEHE